MNVKIIAVIQARMGSTRLPGKVLKKFSNNLNSIEHIVHTLKTTKINKIVIATTVNPEDDLLVEFFKGVDGVSVVRGDETNVLDRFISIIKSENADAVLRICADNPFLFSEGVEFLINKLNKYRDKDYFSFSIASKPSMLTTYGIFAELIRASTLLDRQFTTNVLEQEHVTFNLYGKESAKDVLFSFEKFNFKLNPDFRCTFDTIVDFENIDFIIKKLKVMPPITLDKIKLINHTIVESGVVEKMKNENCMKTNLKNYISKV